MSMTLRRRNLICFYCSSRSAQKQSTGLRQWQCERCEAVNHLDQNGQITDPPSASTPTPKSASNSLRYAHAPAQPLSPPPTLATSQPDTLFCETCVKNQHFYRENLASYLPAEDSPKYNLYLQGYGKYKENLEQRYPQVCASCAPRVRQQIKNSAYVAKTDHLRRMMERTKSGGTFSRRTGGWRGAVISLGGLGYFVTGALQCLWHASEAAKLSYQLESIHMTESLGADKKRQSIQPWFQVYVQVSTATQRMLLDCQKWSSSWMPWALTLAFLTLWWNPRIRTRYLGNGGRMVGLGDYYVLRIISLAVRVGAWFALIRPVRLSVSDYALMATHIFMIAFPPLISLISSTLIKLDTTPRVSFQVSEAMLPKATGLVTNANANTFLGSMNQPWQASGNPFPISSLARPPPSILQSQSQPPLPNLPPAYQNQQQQQANDDDSDAMDWTPSSTPLKTMPTFNQPKSRTPLMPLPNGPSPFHGSLPAAPAPPAHLLRRPAALAPGALRKTSERQKENFFASMTGRRGGGGPGIQQEDDADDSDGGGSRGGVKRVAQPSAAREMKMAPARFFPKEDAVDTGLEAMFDEVFSIRDEPAVGASGADARSDGRDAGSQGPSLGRRLGGLFFGR